MKPFVSMFATIVCLLVFSAAALAQTPVDDIQVRLENGHRVSVTDEGGGEIKGRIVDLTASPQTGTDEIRAGVREGQKVSISEDQGRQLKGRIVSMTAESLTIVSPRERTTVPFAEIVTIDHQKDSLWNGALIGLGAGAALGAWAASNADANYQGDNPFCGMGFFDDCSRDNPAIYVLMWSGVGTIVGTGIDALIYRRDRRIYERRGSPRFNLSPAFGRGIRGAVLSASW